MTEKTIEFDSTDYAGMLYLMDHYKEYNDIYSGVNQFGETMYIFVEHDMIGTRCIQSNGRCRVNYYHRDGTIEELYEK